MKWGVWNWTRALARRCCETVCQVPHVLMCWCTVLAHCIDCQKVWKFALNFWRSRFLACIYIFHVFAGHLLVSLIICIQHKCLLQTSSDGLRCRRHTTLCQKTSSGHLRSSVQAGFEHCTLFAQHQHQKSYDIKLHVDRNSSELFIYVSAWENLWKL